MGVSCARRSPLRILVLEDGTGPVARALAETGRGALEIATAADLAHSPIAEPHAIVLSAGDPRASAQVAEARQRFPGVPVLAALATDDIAADRTLALLRAGASGLLHPSALSLVRALEDARAGGLVVPPALARKLTAASPLISRAGGPSLTAREVEVLSRVARGETNGQVAAALGLSRATVRTHLENVYRKLDVTNRAEAVAEAVRQDLLGDSEDAPRPRPAPTGARRRSARR